MAKKIKKVFWTDDKTKIASEVEQWARKTVSYMEAREYKSAVQSYEDIQLYMGRRLLENTKNGFWWSSNEKYPLIANAWKTYSGMMNRLNLNKVIVSTYAPTVNDKVKDSIKIYKNLVKYFLNKAESKIASMQIIDEALAIGTAYGRVTWHKESTKVVKKVHDTDIPWEKKLEYETIERWYPVLKYCSYFNVIRDLTDANRYIWERYFATKLQLEKDYNISAKDWEAIEKGTSCIFNYDYNKVKNISAWDAEIKSKCMEICNAQASGRWWKTSASKLPQHDNYYSLDKNWLYEVFDVDVNYGDETYNVVLVNGVVVFADLSKQPFPWPKIIQLNFETLPWEVFGRGIGRMGRWYQSSADTLYNSYLNSIKILTNPQFVQDETLSWTERKVHNYVPRGIVSRTSWANTLEKLNLVDASDTQNNLQAIQTIENKFAADLWLNPYVTWQSGWIERSAEWVRQRKLGTDNKVSKFLENINIFFTKAAEKMALLQMVFGQDILDEIDWEKISIKAKDIVTWFMVSFDWEDILWEKSAKTQEAINLLSSIAPFNIDPDTWEPVVDPKRLLNKVFEWIDMYDMVPTQEDRLKEMADKVDYMVNKRELLSKLQWPTDPFDKQNMTITLSGRDLMDIPEAREKILASIWIEVSNTGQGTVEQAQVPVETTDIPIEEPIGRPLNLV